MYLLDPSTSRWSSGPSLPFPLSDGAVVPFNTSFLIVGGVSVDNVGGGGDAEVHYRTVLEFEPVGNRWIIMDAAVDDGRSDHFAIDVPAEPYCS